MQNAEFERLSLDYVYVPAAVAPEHLVDCVKGLRAAGVAGFNVTIPHKQAILPLLDEVSQDAKLVGAVNTVKIEDGRLLGYNTDIDGWVRDVQEDILLDRSAVCLIGAGGAARAIAVGALQAGASRLFICGRNADTIRPLADDLKAKLPDANITWRTLENPECIVELGKCDIVVNSTPVGMESQPGTPISPEWLHENQYVYDSIYVPAETELLRSARLKGCAVKSGIGMLAYQGAVAFEIWTGVQPDVERMKTSLRRALS